MDNKKDLNECARIVYAIMGYNVDEGYDFSKASHPQEQMCFAIAVRTFNFWQPIIIDEVENNG